MRRSALIIKTTVTALAATALTVGLAGTSNAAPGCNGASCNGKDPHTMGCDLDATTLETVNTGEGTILLRWSNACQANWTTMNNVPISGVNFWVENKAGQKQSYGWGWFGPASGWSYMVNGHNILARGCDDDACTGWH